MGIINQGILGGVSGTVGNVVGGSWKGINYIRIKPASYDDAQTEEQVNQRNRFSGCVAFAKSVIDTLIRPIWEKKAVKMTGFNLFMQTNIDVFDDNGQLSDYANLKLSVGDLPMASNLAVVNAATGAGLISITWVDNSGTGIAASSDLLRVAAMSNGELVIIQGLNYTRDLQQANVQLPFGAGETVHVYIFFQNNLNSKYSPDVHQMVQIPNA